MTMRGGAPRWNVRGNPVAWLNPDSAPLENITEGQEGFEISTGRHGMYVAGSWKMGPSLIDLGQKLDDLAGLLALTDPRAVDINNGGPVSNGLDAIFNRLPAAFPGATRALRGGVTAADVLAAPGVATCTKLNGVGSATAGTYTVFVAAGNAHGRTTATQGNVTVTTETVNLGIRAAFSAVAGAVYYDVYCSTDGAASKFVGRVTEAQRASGIIITAVNVTGAGGAANAVDIYVPGTGLAVNGGQLAQNTAWNESNIGAFDPMGAENADVNVYFSDTGDSAAPSLVLLPMYGGTDGYYAGDPVPVSFGGVANAYQSLRQSYRLPVRGRLFKVLVASIAGTGAAVTIEAVAV